MRLDLIELTGLQLVYKDWLQANMNCQTYSALVLGINIVVVLLIVLPITWFCWRKVSLLQKKLRIARKQHGEYVKYVDREMEQMKKK